MARSTSMFLQDFTILDYAFLDAEKGLCGDSLYVSATITGSLDHQGFVWDFGHAKKVLKQKIDELVDHRCLVPLESVPFEALGDQAFSLRMGNLEYSGPLQAIVPLPLAKISLSDLESTLVQILQPHLPSSISQLHIELREEAALAREASFRYTHGLRYHQGNCQRLLHGHRNPIKVFVQGQRSPSLEEHLAQLCDGAHFVAKENLKNLDLPLEARHIDHAGIGLINYRSSQGFFSARMAAKDLIALAEEPSIENIADFLLRSLRRKFPDLPQDICVWAFEGLQKGAAAKEVH